MKLKERLNNWFEEFIVQYVGIIITGMASIKLLTLLVFNVKAVITVHGIVNKGFYVCALLAFLYFFIMSIAALLSEIWFVREVKRRWPMDKNNNKDDKDAKHI